MNIKLILNQKNNRKMYKPFFFLFLLLISTTMVKGQEDYELKFDTDYYNAIDKWVAFPTKDNNYSYGFIYFDDMAGFSFRYENSFTIDKNTLIPAKQDSIKTTMITHRLSKDTRKLHVLNAKELKDLKLPTKPKWLKIYNDNEQSVSYLHKLGYHLNHSGASESAISPLEKGYKLDPNFEGILFELAFAYNATQKFEKAIKLINLHLKDHSKNVFLYKELGYSYLNTNQLDKATKTFEKGIEISKNDIISAEMALNMASVAFNKKDTKAFKKWAALTKKYGKDNPQFMRYIDYFEKELNK